MSSAIEKYGEIWRNTDIQVECWVLEIPDPLAVSIFNSD